MEGRNSDFRNTTRTVTKKVYVFLFIKQHDSEAN